MFEALMPNWASTAGAWLLTYALHSTLLLSLAWIVSRRLAGRAPLAEEAIWRGALLGAVLTASLQLAGGWEPLAGSWQLESTPSPTPLSTRLKTFPLPAVAREVAARPLAPRADEPVAGLSGAPFQVPAGAAVLGLWLMGAFLVGAWHARSYLRLHQRLRHRPEVIGGTLFEGLARLAERAGVRHPVRLGCSSRLPVPVALGVRRPQICVPPRALAQLTAEQQEGMLAHELAHVVRRDPFWLALSNAMVSLFFFQPLNWIARRRMREISELLCDEWAVARTGRPLSLARCLAEVAGWSFEPVRPPLPAAGMADRPSHLARRIRRLLEESGSPETTSRRRWIAVGIGVLLLAVAAVAPGVSAAVGSPDAPALADAPAPPDSPAEDWDEDAAEAEEAPEAPESWDDEAGEAGEDSEAAHEHLSPLHETLSELDEQMADLDSELEDLADLDIDLGGLGDLGDLDVDLGELEDLEDLEDLNLSEEELERISRDAEKIAVRVQTALAPRMERLQELGLRMSGLQGEIPAAEMRKLEAEMEALAEKMRPSDEELARLEAEAERIAASVQDREHPSREERERIAREARELAERYRPSAEEMRKIQELSRQHQELTRKFMEDHRGEIEAIRREAQQQSQAARDEIRRQLEQDPELKALRERHREERERYRQKRHQEMSRRDRTAPKAAPAPRPSPRPGVAPAPQAPPSPKAIPQAAPPPPVARPSRTAPAAAPVAAPSPTPAALAHPAPEPPAPGR